MIDTHIDLPVVGVDETLALSVALGLVIDIPVSWVAAGIEVEGREEVATVVGVYKIVGGRSVDVKGALIASSCWNGTCGSEVTKETGP